MPLTQLPPFWTGTEQEVIAALSSDRSGLSADEALLRLARDGPNELERGTRTTAARLLLRQFESPLVLILVFGSAVAFFIGELTEAAIILAIVAGSTVLGFVQEYRASQAVEALRRRLALTSRVTRGGVEKDVPTREIVAGDIVRLTAGDLVPADGRILEARDFLVSEASLTGEAFPVEKRPGVVAEAAPLTERTNCIFAGCSVRSGEAFAVIAQTGERTQYGHVASRLRGRAPETDFARGLRRFGYLLLRVVVVLVVFVLVISQLLHRPFLESLLFSVALAVGMSPELLPAIVSVTLSAGARTMARSGVLVRRLDAIENLGGIDVLCTDKTGTLTEGAAGLSQTLDADGTPSPLVMELAFANSALETGIENPLDKAVIEAGRASGLDAAAWRKIDEIPYDFQRRMLTIVAARPAAGDAPLLITKGAFQQVLETCQSVRNGQAVRPLDAAERTKLEDRYREFGLAGFRVLALATKRVEVKADYTRDDEHDLVFEGFLAFLDPPKKDAEATLTGLARAGVTVKVITGDNRHVAAHIAGVVGLDATRLLTGADLAKLHGDALLHAVERAAVFVEVDPQQKESIIRALQRNGHSVGFLGDGINDAPALFAADVGISVDQAVDVAREAADVILLERDLGVLRSGIEDGRKAFANTIKYVCITTGSSFGNMVSMALATPLLPFLPLTATQVLLTNFLTDLPLMALASDRVDKEHLEQPQRWSVKDIQSFMLVFGLLSSVFDLATFYVLLNLFHADEGAFRTTWFVVSILTELGALLILRSRRPSWKTAPSWTIGMLSAGVACIALVVPYAPGLNQTLEVIPLSAALLGSALAIVAAYMIATEIAKRVYFRAPPRHASSGSLNR